MDPNGFWSVDLGRLDAILKRKLGQRDMHIPRVAATLTPMPPTVQCMAGAMMLRNPTRRWISSSRCPMGLVCRLDRTRRRQFRGARLWNDVTLTYTVPFVTMRSARPMLVASAILSMVSPCITSSSSSPLTCACTSASISSRHLRRPLSSSAARPWPPRMLSNAARSCRLRSCTLRILSKCSTHTSRTASCVAATPPQTFFCTFLL